MRGCAYDCRDCVLAPFSIPVGPVPISLTTLVIYISVYLLGWKMASLSCFVYILIGMAGLPVFSGFSGGPGKLAGPTGGYIIGFIPMAVITGMMISPCEKQDRTVSCNGAWNRCLLCVWHSLVLRDHGFRRRGCHERLCAAFYSGRYHKNGRGPYNLSGNKKILEIRFLIAYNTIQVKENSSGQGDCGL